MSGPDFRRDGTLSAAFAQKIAELAQDMKLPDAPIKLMEVCGTHTMAIHRHGLKSLLPPGIELISGPGCPVCVTPLRLVDKALSFAMLPGVCFCVYGDMMGVPGSRGSLREAPGADIRVVHSPLDALALARRLPQKVVIFWGVGFETTAPATAAVIKSAAQNGVKNFFVFCAHKTMPAALRLLLAENRRIAGLICPGHVATITGERAFAGLSVPAVIAGFEPVEIMEALYLLVRQIARGEARLQTAYRRYVREEGNPAAQALMGEVFLAANAQWRGLGLIEGSGLKIAPEYAAWDAEVHFEVESVEAEENPVCACGDILRGEKGPRECPLFAAACTPQNPLGPCMVSGEGSCAAAYKYGGF
ncbi:MAG: hydrogenase formation protein HypD [Clostridiales bacterium]|nr:hydrogenase formation protein HypD [Clostridiales bacterium]